MPAAASDNFATGDESSQHDGKALNLETAGSVTESDFDDDDDDDNEDDEQHADRTSTDVRRHDFETLTTEEEAERLLADGGEKLGARDFGRRYQRDGQGETRKGEEKPSRRRRLGRGTRRRRRKELGEDSLMYAVEEGGRSSAESVGSSSEHSSEVDMQTLKAAQAKREAKGIRFGRFAGVHIVILLAFMALVYGAYRASRTLRQAGSQGASDVKPKSLSNGTHVFAPTTILISLDGFRADFLNRGLTPTLSAFVRDGVSPKYMLPSFPSLTFPNHFTLVTGLYPESHGIVGNTFWDPDTEKEFYYTDPARSMTPEWWQGEPLWETAELNGVRTAIHMWPGSEAHIGTREPAYVDKFNADEALDNKVRRILGWLDIPGPDDPDASDDLPRPQLIAAYVPNVDADGHAFGPNSTAIRTTIREVDDMLQSLFQGIEDRNLTDIVNIVVVSDHGMATTSNHRLIQFEDLLDSSLIEHTDGWPLYGLRPYNHDPAHLATIHASLLAKSALPQYAGAFQVHLRDVDMPARYHFSAHARIAPLWIVPAAGWAIVTRDEFNVAAALAAEKTSPGAAAAAVYSPRGLHGYDHEHPLMRAVFVARGPAFPHAPGSAVAPFQNVEVYNVVCDSLGIAPRPNNGTLRLPLQTIGVHDFEAVEAEVAEEEESKVDGEVDFGIPFLPPLFPVDGPQDEVLADELPVINLPEEAGDGDQSGVGEGEDAGEVEEGKASLLAWIKEKFHQIGAWISGDRETGDATTDGSAAG